MNKKLISTELDNMFDAILSLENREECYDFFEDLCTYPELKALSQRFQVATLLLKGHVYNDIVETTGASTATISRVKRSLDNGNDGYKTALKKLGRL